MSLNKLPIKWLFQFHVICVMLLMTERLTWASSLGNAPEWSKLAKRSPLTFDVDIKIDSGESLVHDIDFVSPVVLHEFSATVPIVETHVASVPVVQPFITATLDHPINVGPPDIGHIHTISDVGVTSVIEDHDMMSPDEITIIIDT